MSQRSRALPRAVIVVAFAALLLAFGPIFSVFVERPLAPLLPATPVWRWTLTILVWLLAAAASLTVCRMVTRRANRKPPDR